MQSPVISNNEELNKYFSLLCKNNFPEFILKYIDSPVLKRLSGVGHFCGCDYTKLEFFDVKYWYSRLDHSIACACIAWHLTKDENQTLLALFHDCGTPAFSHCVDYMLQDIETQESAEKNIYDVINNDVPTLQLLKNDNIDINIFKNIKNFPIVENKKPKLCVDRLEGVLSTCLVWRKTWELSDIESFYDDIIVGYNENQEQEISFKNINSCEKFFEGILEYSISMQKNEDKIYMYLVGDILKQATNYKLFKFEDLYKLSENEILNLIKNSNNNKLVEMLDVFMNLTNIGRSDSPVNDVYSISLECKKRYVNPFIYGEHQQGRASELSKYCNELLNQYLNYEDTKYAYIKELTMNNSKEKTKEEELVK
ncbi:MAG: hypothetical protein FWF46_04285 [Oscillospiraceae bacterium]|nr:hypothetical protein [Oscillospiraceae bacterium]